MSQLEKGSCFLFSVSSFTQQNKIKQTTTNKTQNQALRCPGHGPAGFPIKPGLLGSPRPHGRYCCVGTNHSTCEHSHSRLLVFPPLSPLLSPVLYPTCLSAHWRYQKFQIFKAVSVFSVYVGDFIMVRGQKRFSTSHTQTLVRFLFLASLYSVGPTQTATLKCSVQPYHGRTPHPFRYRG